MNTESKITPSSTAAADEHMGHAKAGTPDVTTIGELKMLDTLLKISDGDTSFFMFAIGQNACGAVIVSKWKGLKHRDALLGCHRTAAHRME